MILDSPCQKGRAPLRRSAMPAPAGKSSFSCQKRQGSRCGTRSLLERRRRGTPQFSLPKRQGSIRAARRHGLSPRTDSPCQKGRAPLRPSHPMRAAKSWAPPCQKGRAPLRQVNDRGAGVGAAAASERADLVAAVRGERGVALLSSPCQKGNFVAVHAVASWSTIKLLPAKKAGLHCGTLISRICAHDPDFSLPKRQGSVAATARHELLPVPGLLPCQRARAPLRLAVALLPAKKAELVAAATTGLPPGTSSFSLPKRQGSIAAPPPLPRCSTPRPPSSLPKGRVAARPVSMLWELKIWQSLLPCQKGRAPLRHSHKIPCRRAGPSPCQKGQGSVADCTRRLN